jgi:hypothetical protein
VPRARDRDDQVDHPTLRGQRGTNQLRQRYLTLMLDGLYAVVAALLPGPAPQ